ncbi:MAG: hypothetical protein WC236_10830 [Gallionellaceae bacterium]|jgi:hypothetical protein
MKILIILFRLIQSIFSKSSSSQVGDEIKEEPMIWRPENITAQIRADNVYLKIGKYLHLEQKLEPGECGWIKSKLKIPESWTVLDVSFHGDDLILDVKDYGKYLINPSNKGPLSYAIHSAKGKEANNQKFEDIWNEHAKMPPG